MRFKDAANWAADMRVDEVIQNIFIMRRTLHIMQQISCFKEVCRRIEWW